MIIARYLKSAVDLPEQKFVYRLVNRPAGMYLPEGYGINSFGRYNGGSDGTYGTIYYKRPLTELEKKEYELLECVSTDEAVKRILSDAGIVEKLKPYANDKRTNVYNESDNPFAHFFEDFMFRRRFYSDWRGVLVKLKSAII